MGKASRRKKDAQGKTKVAPAPYVARPFEGLPGEVTLAPGQSKELVGKWDSSGFA